MSNLEQISPVHIKVGDTIRFTVKDLNDTNVYSGKVVSICDYTSARAYSDIAATHLAMLAADSTIPDVTLLRYLIVEDQDDSRRPYGYASDGSNSWFSDNKLVCIDQGAEYSIKLYNCSSENANQAIRILREHGFTCNLITK